MRSRDVPPRNIIRFSSRWPVSARQEALIKAVHVVNESGLVRLQKTFGENWVSMSV